MTEKHIRSRKASLISFRSAPRALRRITRGVQMDVSIGSLVGAWVALGALALSARDSIIVQLLISALLLAKTAFVWRIKTLPSAPLKPDADATLDAEALSDA